MEYDSVLDQQSISGKNVSLILCVWKPGYMKSGHIYLIQSIVAKLFWIRYHFFCIYIHQIRFIAGSIRVAVLLEYLNLAFAVRSWLANHN